MKVVRSVPGLLLAGLALTACDSGLDPQPAGSMRLEIVAGDGQEGLHPYRLDSVVVRLVDARDRPVPGAPVRFLITSGSGSVSPDRVTTDASGRAAASWIVGDDPSAVVQRLSARVDDPQHAAVPEVQFRAQRMARERADLVALVEADGFLGLLLHSGDGNRPLVYRTAEAGAVLLQPAGEMVERDELVAFAADRPPAILTDVRFTTGRDSLTLVFPAPVEIDLAVWIVKRPFAEMAAVARQQLEVMDALWVRSWMGIRVGNAEIVDATAFPAAEELQGNHADACGTGVPTRIGQRPGMMNVYFVGGLGPYAGVACSPLMVMMAGHSGQWPNLLAHEIGHVFGLQHVNDPTNVMNPFPGARMEIGQVYAAHFDVNSALNTVYGMRAAHEQRHCFQLPGQRRCVPTIFTLN